MAPARQYTVERIEEAREMMNDETKKNEWLYKIKWAGYVQTTWQRGRTLRTCPLLVRAFWLCATNQESRDPGLFKVAKSKRVEYQDLARDAVLGAPRAGFNGKAGSGVMDVGCLSVPPEMLGFELRRDERFRLVKETIDKTPMAAGSSGAGIFRRVKMDDRESEDWRKETCMFCSADHPVQPILLACPCRFRAYSQECMDRWVQTRAETGAVKDRSDPWSYISCPQCRVDAVPVHQKWVDDTPAEKAERDEAYRRAQKIRKKASKKTEEGKKREKERRKRQAERKRLAASADA